jgi:hypothetical protein
MIFAGLGEDENAFCWLEKASEWHPQFQNLLRRLSLP